MSLTVVEGMRAKEVEVRVKGHPVTKEYSQTGNRVLITLKNQSEISANQSIEVRLS
jgi:hypothetical protein